MFRKLAWLGASSLLALATFSGCVIDGSESGANASVEAQTDISLEYDTDSKREGALGLVYGMSPIDDRLDFNKNDKEDWRYIIIAMSGQLTITLNLDTPDKIEGGWKLYDSESRSIYAQSFSRGQNFYEYSFPVKPGIFYFQTFADSGSSIYTVGTTFTPSQVVMPAPDPEPEPDPEPVTKPKTKKHRDASSGDSEKPRAKSEPADDGATIKGFISLITPKDDGTAEVKISGCGKNKGVESGAIGKLEGTNIKIEMTQCLATSCRAIIPASVDLKKLKKGANVIFRVD